MTKNIAEVLGQGSQLDGMVAASSTLSAESRRYAQRSKELHTRALIRKYAPIGVVLFVVTAVLWFRAWLSHH